jgi:hypothetical protein
MLPLARAFVAVLATPAVLATGRWRRLLASAGALPSAPVPDVRLRASDRMLRGLAKLPFSPWRATCLYRSVAACLQLRWSGVPAVLRVGAAGSPGSGTARAHAWVEDAAGTVLYERRTGFTALGAP